MLLIGGSAEQLSSDDTVACGTCRDPTRAGDTEQPAPGAGFFYLKGVVHELGEGSLGSSTDGTIRLPSIACP